MGNKRKKQQTPMASPSTLRSFEPVQPPVFGSDDSSQEQEHKSLPAAADSNHQPKMAALQLSEQPYDEYSQDAGHGGGFGGGKLQFSSQMSQAATTEVSPANTNTSSNAFPFAVTSHQPIASTQHPKPAPTALLGASKVSKRSKPLASAPQSNSLDAWLSGSTAASTSQSASALNPNTSRSYASVVSSPTLEPTSSMHPPAARFNIPRPKQSQHSQSQSHSQNFNSQTQQNPFTTALSSQSSSPHSTPMGQPQALSFTSQESEMSSSDQPTQPLTRPPSSRNPQYNAQQSQPQTDLADYTSYPTAPASQSGNRAHAYAMSMTQQNNTSQHEWSCTPLDQSVAAPSQGRLNERLQHQRINKSRQLINNSNSLSSHATTLSRHPLAPGAHQRHMLHSQDATLDLHAGLAANVLGNSTNNQPSSSFIPSSFDTMHKLQTHLPSASQSSDGDLQDDSSLQMHQLRRSNQPDPSASAAALPLLPSAAVNAFLNEFNRTDSRPLPKTINNLSNQHAMMQSQLIRDYSNILRVGHGAFGDVSKGRHRLDGCEYAIKCIRKPFKLNAITHANAATASATHLRELHALAALNCAANRPSSVLTYHGSWLEYDSDSPLQGNNRPVIIYFATELCTGGTLAKRIEPSKQRVPSSPAFGDESRLAADDDHMASASKPVKPAELIEIARQLFEALHFMHALSIAHLDIKPANILESRAGSGVYKLADYGLAAALNESAAFVEGDKYYLPPEALDHGMSGVAVQLDKIDMFALGMTLYELATGCPLHLTPDWQLQNVKAGGDISALENRYMHEQKEADETSNTSLPEWFLALIRDLLHSNPSDRPSATHCLDIIRLATDEKQQQIARLEQQLVDSERQRLSQQWEFQESQKQVQVLQQQLIQMQQMIRR